MKISVKQLQKLGACEEGIAWFKQHKIKELVPLIEALLHDSKDHYARWLIARLLTRSQQVLWAIYSAEKVINLYEKQYPSNESPRKAIEAAKGVLDGTISKGDANAAYAANAAANAAYAAAYAANAAYAAANAAYAAAYAANAAAYAANAAAYAANAAAYAANAAYAAANAAYAAATREIMNYALMLLGEK